MIMAELPDWHAVKSLIHIDMRAVYIESQWMTLMSLIDYSNIDKVAYRPVFLYILCPGCSIFNHLVLFIEYVGTNSLHICK